MTARWVAFLTWAAVAAGSVYWLLKLVASPSPVPAHAQVVATAARAAADLQRVLGAGASAAAPTTEPAASPVPTDPRFNLVGVVAPRPGSSPREGIALIAADDQPAKAFRVGAVVDGTLVLLSVSSRGASLGPRGGPPSVVMELPEVPGPATGGAPGGADGAPPEPGAPVAPGVPVARAPVRVPPALAPPRPIVAPPPVLPQVPMPNSPGPAERDARGVPPAAPVVPSAGGMPPSGAAQPRTP